jgi:hypothetical protein
VELCEQIFLKRGYKNRTFCTTKNCTSLALINHILGYWQARTANTLGVMYLLQWIRVQTDETKTKKKEELKLLDSSGIIPTNLVCQAYGAVLRLASRYMTYSSVIALCMHFIVKETTEFCLNPEITERDWD